MSECHEIVDCAEVNSITALTSSPTNMWTPRGRANLVYQWYNTGRCLKPGDNIRKESLQTSGGSRKEMILAVSPEELEKLLRLESRWPLKDVEDVVLPPPLETCSSVVAPGVSASKRGRRSAADWLKEISLAWGNLYREDKLQESWLASLPMVERLAASKYGGGIVGKGMALKTLLQQALSKARQQATDERVRALLTKYPNEKMTDIAAQLGLSREQVSRRYCTQAASLLVMTFQGVLEQSA
jgi:hypothetical protein